MRRLLRNPIYIPDTSTTENRATTPIKGFSEPVRPRSYLRTGHATATRRGEARKACPLSICFFSHTGVLAGGAEKSLLETVTLLRDRGFSCFVFVPFEGALTEELEAQGFPYAVAPYQRWTAPPGTPWYLRVRHLLKNLLLLPYLVAFCRRHGFDVYYTNTITIPVGAMVAFALRRRHIWHIRELGTPIHGITFTLGETISRTLMGRLSVTLLTNSHTVATAYANHIPEKKLLVAYQAVLGAVSAVARKRKPGEPFRCIIVGTLQASKGQEEAIHALGLLRDMGVPVELTIVGTGAEEYCAHLAKLTERLQLEDRVRLIGYLDKPAEAIAASDVLLMCSRQEAFGRVTIEAMKHARPVVGARSGATAEIVQDGFNGLLYEPGDAGDLAAKVRFLYEQPQAVAELGLQAKEWADTTFTATAYGDTVARALHGATGSETAAQVSRFSGQERSA